MLASSGSQQLSSCSSKCQRMKWWTDCCDQLFLGFKTPQLWVARHCSSSTPLPTSRRGRHIDGLDLDSRRAGVPSEAANQRAKTDPQFADICLKLPTEPPKGRANWRLAALSKNSFCFLHGTADWCCRCVLVPGTATSVQSPLWWGRGRLATMSLSFQWKLYWLLHCSLNWPLLRTQTCSRRQSKSLTWRNTGNPS